MKRTIDTLWLLALMAYVLAGVHLVPFHGDESTTTWMSKDAAYWFGQAERLRYDPEPQYPDEQQLRLITGSLTKYLMGVLWGMNGYHVDDINEQWHWGFDWTWNIQNGHAPDGFLLMLGRWPSALMLAVSVGVVFALGLQVGQRPAAYIASGYYALHPVVLLNGRRAMFEGGLLLFALLAVLLIIYTLRYRHWFWAVLLGIAGGLALSAKHPAAFTLVAVFGAGGFYALRQARDLLPRLAVAAVLVGGVFFVLHPVWWGDPLARVGHVLEARTGILNDQVNLFGGYTDFADQTAGFARQLAAINPQYYEVPEWAGYINELIASYESSPWAGVDFPPLHVLMMALAVFGTFCLEDAPTRWIVLAWAGGVLLSSWLLTPIEWQRYYLLCYPVIAVLSAAAIVKLGSRWRGGSAPSAY